MTEKENKSNNNEIENNDRENEVLDYYSDIRTNNENEKNEKNEEENKKHNTNNTKEPVVIDEIDLNQINDDDKLSQSLKNILLDKEFASPILIKKENKLFTDFHYVTFQNSYGENTCYVNVILHLLYYIPELEEYLISLYQIDLANEGKDKNEIDNTNRFLVLLGKILYQYENIITEENDLGQKRIKKPNPKKKQVTVIKTLNMRKVLEIISYNKFPLNTIADPVELFTFILEILNNYLEEDLHKSFYLELTDEFTCKSQNNCQINVENKYDKDNFIYHIYIDEILKNIEQGNLKVKDYKSKLFEYSYNLFASQKTKKCEKCKEELTHNLICMNYPEFLLINCVWNQSNPIVDDVISFFFLLSLKDDLNNLFVCNRQKTRRKFPYYLLGFILYSFTLSHYIICVYNYDKKVFILLDDEIVKEYNNLYDLLIDITVNVLKVNGKAFFYPVMLIYTHENLFDNKIIKLNTLNDSEYQGIINKCNEAIYEYQLNNNMQEEEKLINLQEYIKKQKEIEDSIKRREKRKNRYKVNEKEKDEKVINDIEINENETNEKEINNIDSNKNEKNKYYNKEQKVNNIETDNKHMNEDTPFDDKDMKEETPIDDKDMKEETPIDDKDMKEETPIDDKDMKEETPIDDKDMKEETLIDDKDMKGETPIDDKDMKEETPIDDKDMNDETPIDDKDMNDETPIGNKDMNDKTNYNKGDKRQREKDNNKYYKNKEKEDNEENKENKEEEDIKINEEENNSINIKEGLEKRNINKLSLIYQDIKKAKQNKSTIRTPTDKYNDINNSYKKNRNDDNIDVQGNELNNDKGDIKNNNNKYNNRRNNYNKSYIYYSGKEKEKENEGENKEIYKKRNNISDKTNYSLRNNQKNNEYNSNKKENYISTNTENIKNNKENNVESDLGNKRRRTNNTIKSTIIMNPHRRSYINEENKKKENNFEENQNNGQKTYKRKIYDKAYVYTKNKNNTYTNWKTPKKERFHSNLYKNTNEDNDTNNNALFNNYSEKKSNIFKSQFIGKKIINSSSKDCQNKVATNNNIYPIKNNNESNDSKYSYNTTGGSKSRYNLRNKK